MSACATPNCGRPAAWISITEGNILSSAGVTRLPRRCRVCCDAIAAVAEVMIQAEKCVVPEHALYSAVQERAAEIRARYRGTVR